MRCPSHDLLAQPQLKFGYRLLRLGPHRASTFAASIRLLSQAVNTTTINVPNSASTAGIQNCAWATIYAFIVPLLELIARAETNWVEPDMPRPGMSAPPASSMYNVSRASRGG